MQVNLRYEVIRWDVYITFVIWHQDVLFSLQRSHIIVNRSLAEKGLGSTCEPMLRVVQAFCSKPFVPSNLSLPKQGLR